MAQDPAGTDIAHKRRPFRPLSLRMRMALVFALLFTVVQATMLVLVDHVGLKFARERTAHDLQVGKRLFANLLDQNRERLMQAAEVVSKD
jgi:hypothetical protein